MDARWDRLLPLLAQYVSLGSLRPYLVQKGLLAADEHEIVLKMTDQPQRQQVESVVVMMRRKGPHSLSLLLEALQDSVESDPHSGHIYIIEKMEELVKSGKSDEVFERVTTSLSSDLVRYLKFINRVIDGLDPGTFQRCVMALGVLGTTIPSDVTDFPKLFEHLNKIGKCGPQSLTLLQNMLESISRPDLVRMVQDFSHPATLVILLSKAVQSVEALQGRLATVLSLELSAPEVVESGCTIRWTGVQCDHVSLQTRAKGSSALGDLDVQRVFVCTSRGEKFLVWEAQQAVEESTPDLNVPCSEQALFDCSRELVEWQRLAVPLGFSWAEKREIELDCGSSYSEQKVEFLLRWKRKKGSEATFHSLIAAAVHSGDQHFAEAVRRIASAHTAARNSL